MFQQGSGDFGLGSCVGQSDLMTLPLFQLSYLVPLLEPASSSRERFRDGVSQVINTLREMHAFVGS